MMMVMMTCKIVVCSLLRKWMLLLWLYVGYVNCGIYERQNRNRLDVEQLMRSALNDVKLQF